MPLSNRPRIYNALHALHLVQAHTETQPNELACLARYAKGCETAIEIGTFMGVSAARIAASLSVNGRIYCVDPYYGGDALLKICLRHLRRHRVFAKVELIRLLSHEAIDKLPPKADFIFVDGDHSWKGIES